MMREYESLSSVPVRGLLLTLSLAGLAGCTAGNGRPSDGDYDEVAAGVGALVANESGGGEVAAFDDSIELSAGTTPSGVTRTGTGSFSGMRGGVRYDYTIDCRDAAGSSQAACGEQTDSARLILAWDGEWNLPRRHIVVTRTGDWTLSGLSAASAGTATSNTAELNGHGTLDVSSEFSAPLLGEERTFALDYDASYDAVQIRLDDRTPVGGAIRYEVHAERTRETRRRSVDASFDITADVQFVGDGHAIVELDGYRTYDLDLHSGALSDGATAD